MPHNVVIRVDESDVCALASGSSSIGVGFDVGLSIGGYACCVGLGLGLVCDAESESEETMFYATERASSRASLFFSPLACHRLRAREKDA